MFSWLTALAVSHYDNGGTVPQGNTRSVESSHAQVTMTLSINLHTARHHTLRCVWSPWLDCEHQHQPQEQLKWIPVLQLLATTVQLIHCPPKDTPHPNIISLALPHSDLGLIWTPPHPPPPTHTHTKDDMSQSVVLMSCMQNTIHCNPHHSTEWESYYFQSTTKRHNAYFYPAYIKEIAHCAHFHVTPVDRCRWAHWGQRQGYG